MGYCGWSSDCTEDKNYHDSEWGIPTRDDKRQFEHLCLEVLQCGLSWRLMMKKRAVFRQCFAQFDYDKVAAFTADDVERILNTPEMIRSERKIAAIVRNARLFLEIRREYGSFSDYLWRFTDGKTVVYRGHGAGKIPVSNGLSETVSKDLKRRGFKYLGPIVVYSHLQTCGIICDHDADCPRYAEILRSQPVVFAEPYLEKF